MEVKELFDFVFNTACESFECDNPDLAIDDEKKSNVVDMINMLRSCVENNRDTCSGFDISVGEDGNIVFKLGIKGFWINEQ